MGSGTAILLESSSAWLHWSWTTFSSSSPSFKTSCGSTLSSLFAQMLQVCSCSVHYFFFFKVFRSDRSRWSRQSPVWFFKARDPVWFTFILWNACPERTNSLTYSVQMQLRTAEFFFFFLTQDVTETFVSVPEFQRQLFVFFCVSAGVIIIVTVALMCKWSTTEFHDLLEPTTLDWSSGIAIAGMFFTFLSGVLVAREMCLLVKEPVLYHDL